MRLLLIAAALAVAACATPPPGPSVPVEVPIPVGSQRCKAQVPDCLAELPGGAYALSQVSEADRFIVRGRAAIAEVKQRQACEVRLRAALKACTD